MKKQLSFLAIILLLLAGDGVAQVLRPFGVRYNNPSVRGNIVYVSNNIITAAGQATNEVAPGGTSTNNNGAAQYLDVDNISTTIIAPATSWKYLADNTRPAGWETSAFADGSWSTGTLTGATRDFGYGDNDEDVCIPYGCNANICYPTTACAKYITTLFRKQFTVTGLANFSGFQINLHRDDGAVIYVNGVEVARSNMPTGTITNLTQASTNVDGATEDVVINIGTTGFVEGANTIAVEIHQFDAVSTDISFRLGMTATYPIILPYGSNWKYLDNNTRPASWESVGFNDVAWASGNAELGYGDADEATVVSYGVDAANKYITTYFRKVINIPNPSLYTSYILNLIRDDGAVVYINGVEVARSAMPAGAVTHTTFANVVASGAAESTPVNFVIPVSAFVAGNNTIAVEVHQESVASTDISFNMQITGSNDPTFSSTSADLNLASCSHILWAGLYWGATQGTNGANTSWITGETTVKLKIPGAANYQDVTAMQTDYHNNTLVPGLPHTGYRAYADITSLLNANSPNGTYTLGNVVGPIGINNGSGGWTIVIAYANASQATRNLTVFDGSAIMNGGDPAMFVPITGFLTPPTGPVSCELGAVVYDGDRGGQDEFSFKQNSNPLIGTYTNLTPNTNSNLNDMWNSTISYKGVDITTRNPAHTNTLGYDADILDVPNASNAVLGNNQTSASIRFSSPSENYFIQMVSTAISVFSPTFTVEKSSTDLNGGAQVAGDIIRYTLNYQNVGNDASIQSRIIDNLPAATGFVPGSIRINSIAKTDASADDEAEFDFVNRRVIFRVGSGANSTTGGTIATAGTGTVTFDVYAATSCQVLSCGSPTSNTARMEYVGQTSTQSLYDSSGYISGGCFTRGAVVNVITGSCFVPKDTTLLNTCPASSVTIPQSRYAGYSFFSAMPFTAGNAFNPNTIITQTHTYYAYFNAGAGCSDTIRINVFILACPDIDDDNDGIPDYVEINNPLALSDADGDLIPNWKDTDYAGYVDNNADGFNDNFDPAADANNNGIPNFLDPTFPGFIDANGDGVNDKMDADLDGVPNNFDLDSDNDGIPDVVEAFGVDANGDGRIDNYTDTDNDGFSQNVDGNNTGVAASGNGLGARDTDGDGIPNYFDLDSDNDGIPDVREVYGTDTNNDGRIDNITDTDGDGFNDAVDGDVGNDGTAENTANALLVTGADGNNDGRCDSWPSKNIDRDSVPNPYDLDSDSDGITDVREAGIADVNYDGFADGTINANGWSGTIAALSSLTLPNTDATGPANAYDIDSDDDGIPDNVEGQPTSIYHLPSGTDTDADGIDNTYDNVSGFGGDGIHPVNTDGDAFLDYLDTDTDNDGRIDRIEGNDFNFNHLADDNVTLIGVDTDGDGLDDRFDMNNSSAEGTSQYMGELGSTTGDATPGSRTVVQRTVIIGGCATERDWRCLPYVLHCQLLTFKAALQNDVSNIEWETLCDQDVSQFVIERSIDRIHFEKVATVAGKSKSKSVQHFSTEDHIGAVNSSIVYYRLIMVTPDNETSLSNIVSVRKTVSAGNRVQIAPNPVKESLQLLINSAHHSTTSILVVDAHGKTVRKYTETLLGGTNTFVYNDINSLPAGIYYLRIDLGNEIVNKKFVIIK